MHFENRHFSDPVVDQANLGKLILLLDDGLLISNNFIDTKVSNLFSIYVLESMGCQRFDA